MNNPSEKWTIATQKNRGKRTFEINDTKFMIGNAIFEHSLFFFFIPNLFLWCFCFFSNDLFYSEFCLLHIKYSTNNNEWLPITKGSSVLKITIQGALTHLQTEWFNWIPKWKKWNIWIPITIRNTFRSLGALF